MIYKTFHLTATGWMFIQTIAVLFIGVIQACIYRLISRNADLTNRAYVAMNVWFRQEPRMAFGLSGNPVPTGEMNTIPIPIVYFFDRVEDPHAEISLTVAIKNFGNTPATVTDIVLSTRVGEPNSLPDDPKSAYDRSRMIPPDRSCAFLVKDGRATFNLTVRINETSWAAPEHGQLWLLGHVDYVDQFKQTHRAGFARICVTAPVSGTGFVPGHAIDHVRFEMKEGYNYDD